MTPEGPFLLFFLLFLPLKRFRRVWNTKKCCQLTFRGVGLDWRIQNWPRLFLRVGMITRKSASTHMACLWRTKIFFVTHKVNTHVPPHPLFELPKRNFGEKSTFHAKKGHQNTFGLIKSHWDDTNWPAICFCKALIMLMLLNTHVMCW